MRRLFLKLDTLMYLLLLSCAPGPPTSLSILVRASLHCSVKGVVHSIVPDLQFFGNFLHGIAFITVKRSLKHFCEQAFLIDLSGISWNDIDLIPSVDDAWLFFKVPSSPS